MAPVVRLATVNFRAGFAVLATFFFTALAVFFAGAALLEVFLAGAGFLAVFLAGAVFFALFAFTFGLADFALLATFAFRTARAAAAERNAIANPTWPPMTL